MADENNQNGDVELNGELDHDNDVGPNVLMEQDNVLNGQLEEQELVQNNLNGELEQIVFNGELEHNQELEQLAEFEQLQDNVEENNIMIGDIQINEYGSNFAFMENILQDQYMDHDQNLGNQGEGMNDDDFDAGGGQNLGNQGEGLNDDDLDAGGAQNADN